MGQKKDTRSLGRRRKAQAQSQSQDAITPGLKASMPAPSPKNKVDRSADKSAEKTAPKTKRNAGAVRLLKRVQASEIRDFTAAQLQRFAPSGFISRAEKMMVRRRLTIVAILLSVLAAVLAGITNYALVDSTPQRAVNSYMSALQGGHYLRALGRSVYRDDTAVLLKDSMYRAGEGRVESYSIVDMAEGDSTAQATVDTVVSGQHQTVTLNLHKVKKTGIFNDQWELDAEPQINEQLTSPLALDSLNVNGKKLRLGSGTTVADNSAGAVWTIPLLPGNYTFSLPDTSYYSLTRENPTVTVPLQDQQNQSLNLGLRPSPRMWNETNDAINKWLSTCTESRSLAPRGCPASSLYKDDGTQIANPTSAPTAGPYQLKHAEVKDVTWTLVKKPTFALEHAENDFSTWNANPEATYRLAYTVDGVKYTETIPFTIKAQVHSTGDSARIHASLKNQGDSTVTRKETSTAPQPSSTTKKG